MNRQQLFLTITGDTMKTTLRGLAMAAACCAAAHATAQSTPIKVGLMLPATGTYASLGSMIENGFRLYVAEHGGKLAGHEIVYARVDDESDPSKASDIVNKLIKLDQVDLLVGTVHSGVALTMAKVAKETGTLLIVPNAGANAITGPMCARNIFRSSFSSWQSGYAMGKVAAERGHKRIVTITWNYAFGNESVAAFTEGFEKAGGKVTESLSLPFPNVGFQALLTQLAAQKPDAVYAFFAGGGAATLLKHDAAQMCEAGLKAAGGDVKQRAKVIAGMEAAVIDSPRGSFRMSAAHNPVQDIYLREVKGGDNVVKGVAIKALSDPAKGCRM